MFKIEVTKPSDSSVHGFYWMNKHEDDFARFLPDQFTRELGEVITKNDIEIFKFDESLKAVLEGKLAQEGNRLDTSEHGKFKVLNEADDIELELTGAALAQWPYDSQGNFLGNI